MANKRLMRILAMMLTLALVGAACGTSTDDQADGDGNGDAVPTSATAAADLRSGLTALLGEHVYLAALATGSALRGDNAGFEAWAAALNGPTNSNSADLTAAIASVYGDEVGNAFDGLWRSDDHIPAFVRYTQAIAANNSAAADDAVADALAYAKTFGETMESVNENLPAAAVEEGVVAHITTLKAVIDAQKAGNQPAVYSSLREAYHHMDEFAKTLAGATVAKFSEDIEGDSSSAASDLRAGMTSLLQEHVYLAASATGGALGGRNAQFEAAANALNGPARSNSADITAAITSVYGNEVGNAFDGLWRSDDHIPAFVRYTQAIAADDSAAAQAAVDDALAYAATFGETMESVNENLPADVVEQEIIGHITSLKDVIDAQKAGNATDAATKLRAAAHHMRATAAALAEGTVVLFPEKF